MQQNEVISETGRTRMNVIGFWPWKKSPLGCFTAGGDAASHTAVSAPMASVLSLDCILAWKDGMDDWTATEERKTESQTLMDTWQQKWCPCVYLVCRPSPGAWRRSGSLCVEKPICPSESPAASVTATTQQTHLNKHGHTTTITSGQTAAVNQSPVLCSERRPWCRQTSPSQTGGRPRSASVWACRPTTPSPEKKVGGDVWFLFIYLFTFNNVNLPLYTDTKLFHQHAVWNWTNHSGVFNLLQCWYQRSGEYICTCKYIKEFIHSLLMTSPHRVISSIFFFITKCICSKVLLQTLLCQLSLVDHAACIVDLVSTVSDRLKLQ